MQTHGHTPVLLEQATGAVLGSVDGCYVDCTFGRGGHSRRLLRDLGPRGRLLAIDRDPEAVAAGRALAAGDSRLTIVRGSFGELASVAGEWLAGEALHGVLFDLGVSSPQVDDPRRGFSFQEDGPLDMRMDPEEGQSAAEWLSRVGETELARVLREYGEERYARRIARAIVSERVRRPIDTTMKLVEIIKRASPARERGKHPATRCFQAIRIRVNDELGALESGLTDAVELLAPGGHLAVISFHSLEDRLVKRFIRTETRPPDGPFAVPLPSARPRLKPVGKPVRASAAECEANPRARSAVLRVAERIG